MLRNYLKIAWRNLTRDATYTVINLSGLAVGFLCCILIALYVHDELSYDTFHENGERVVLIGAGSVENASQMNMSTSYPLGDALVSDLPIVEKTVRVLWPGSGDVSEDGRVFREVEGVFHVGAAFFEMFDFELLRGDPEAVLSRPNTAVISREFAEQHFGDADPIGETIHARRYGEREYEITGIAESQRNSYLDFNILLSLASTGYAESHGDLWGGRMFQTFALLQEGATSADVHQSMPDLVQRYYGDDAELEYFAMPVAELYLSNMVSVDGFRGEWRYIYIFGTVALIILLLACLNYTNLMTARAAGRSKELGVRRTIGAARTQVAGQFLFESALLAAVAFGVALGLTQLSLPGFNRLFDTEIVLASAAVPVIGGLAVAAILTGVLSGSYPAFYLSALNPSTALRGGHESGRSRGLFRKGLVSFQFGLAIVLMICTAIVYQQLNFALTADLGFEDEQVMYTAIPSGSGQAYQEAVDGHSSIVASSIAQALPGAFRGQLSLKVSQFSPEAGVDEDASIRLRPATVDHGYLETLGLELVAGRDFSRDFPADAREAAILNQNTVHTMGWTPEEDVGRSFSLSREDDHEGRVIGVVRDFHTGSFREEIAPIALSLYPTPISASERLAIRVGPDQIEPGRAHIEAQWARFSDEPVEISFLDDDFAAMYATEERLSRVFTLFALLAMLIACMGLFALAAYAAQRRTKEIGIRKVLGATAKSVVALLSKDFLRLVLIGFVIAVPVAYLLMQRWLQDFAYRIDIGVLPFLVTALLVTLIAAATVSYHALRAAWTDPAVALRDE